MVGIVIVAHSRELAEALKRFAVHVVHRELPIAAAGGVDDAQNPYGTNAMAIRDAVNTLIGGDGVVVLMDMGSSLLSAEVALDFLPEELRGRVRLCGAPLVEGVIAAAVCAAGGGTLDDVVLEALGSMAPKSAHLGSGEAPGPRAGDERETGSGSKAREIVLEVHTPLGLHLRPAAQLVRTATRYESEITVRNVTRNSSPVSAKSINLVATLAEKPPGLRDPAPRDSQGKLRPSGSNSPPHGVHPAGGTGRAGAPGEGYD